MSDKRGSASFRPNLPSGEIAKCIFSGCALDSELSWHYKNNDTAECVFHSGILINNVETVNFLTKFLAYPQLYKSYRKKCGA